MCPPGLDYTWVNEPKGPWEALRLHPRPLSHFACSSRRPSSHLRSFGVAGLAHGPKPNVRQGSLARTLGRHFLNCSRGYAGRCGLHPRPH